MISPAPPRRRTAHLKAVPQPRSLRERIRGECLQVAAGLDKSHPLGKDEMEQLARRTLAALDLPDSYVGWTMVVLASEFWREQVAAIPPERRLFLLPHCLKQEQGCPAELQPVRAGLRPAAGPVRSPITAARPSRWAIACWSPKVRRW